MLIKKTLIVCFLFAIYVLPKQTYKNDNLVIFKKTIERIRLEDKKIIDKKSNGVLKYLFEYYVESDKNYTNLPLISSNSDLQFLKNQINTNGTWDKKFSEHIIDEKKLDSIRKYLVKNHKNEIYGFISSIIFSKDKKYAIVACGYTDILTKSQGISYLLLFKKERGKWLYHSILGTTIS